MIPTPRIEREIARLSLPVLWDNEAADIYASGARRALKWVLSEGKDPSEADLLGLPEIE